MKGSILSTVGTLPQDHVARRCHDRTGVVPVGLLVEPILKCRKILSFQRVSAGDDVVCPPARRRHPDIEADEKVERLLRELRTGRAALWFDPETETTSAEPEP